MKNLYCLVLALFCFEVTAQDLNYNYQSLNKKNLKVSTLATSTSLYKRKSRKGTSSNPIDPSSRYSDPDVKIGFKKFTLSASFQDQKKLQVDLPHRFSIFCSRDQIAKFETGIAWSLFRFKKQK